MRLGGDVLLYPPGFMCGLSSDSSRTAEASSIFHTALGRAQPRFCYLLFFFCHAHMTRQVNPLFERATRVF